MKRELDPLVLETFEEMLAELGHPSIGAPRAGTELSGDGRAIGVQVVNDTLMREAASESGAPRQRFILEDTGFDEVPKKYRRFYRRQSGPGDTLAPNEAICPVCKVVIRSTRELREGDRVYCMPCMSRLVIFRSRLGSPRGARRLLNRPTVLALERRCEG